MPITIRDVAKEAGVSVKTVSRVINNEPLVSKDTRAKVTTVMKQLGYTPNISAQRLARGRAYVIGLIFHNATWNYINDVMRGMLETCRSEGYETLIHPCDIDKLEDQAEILGLAEKQYIDGLIFTPPCDNATTLLENLRSINIPFIRLTPQDRQVALPYVTANDWQGAYEMTEYLLGLGHRQIGFITGNPTHQASQDRLAGFKAALERHEVSLDQTLIKQGDFHFESGVSCGHQLMTMNPRPTAIFASNDNMAVGVLATAHKLKIAVPTEISIAGFDDVRLVQQVWPPLTTVHQPIYESAKLATQLLIHLLEQDTLDVLHHTLPTTLIIRESTAPPLPLR